MKLKSKILLVFGLAFIVNAAVVLFGLVFVLDSLSSLMMKKQAEHYSLFLQHRIAETHALQSENPISALEHDLLSAKHIADESKGFEVETILLVKPDLSVEASFPVSERGNDYSSHEDIRDAFVNKNMETVYEQSADLTSDGKPKTDIDVVSWFSLEDGQMRVLEVKLDFAKSVALVEAQYSWMELVAIISGLAVLVMLLAVLLYLIQRTVLRPVGFLSFAMERMGSGDLDVRLNQQGNDEFALLSKSFNEMIVNLKEKLLLYKYVSQGTIQAVKGNLAGKSDHAAVRTTLTIFFSDIRGFTSFSESRDPSEVITTLNKILSIQSEIIHRHGGDIDKFVGDEVMAVFSSPYAAVSAAIEIQQAIDTQRDQVESLRIGIGIYEGEVFQGDVGSDEMKDFTVIGDSVNTAARMQGAAKGGEIFISESIALNQDISTTFALSERGLLQLKGKSKQIRVYTVERQP